VSRYEGKIKVVGVDLMCWPVNPATLEATACSTYDPYAWCDPEREPIETISHDEWTRRLNRKWKKERT
jgi:hypothetical protein